MRTEPSTCNDVVVRCYFVGTVGGDAATTISSIQFPEKDYFGLHAIFAASRPAQVPVVSPTSIGNRMESWIRVYGLVERRNAYKLAVASARKRIIAGIQAKFSPEAVRAYEVEAD